MVSEFVPGSRLSDLLDHAADQGAAPGLDVAFGFLLDVLPALCGLHAAAGFAHGTISPSRTVLTPAGQVVLQDGIYGGALSHLRYSRRKLWADFGIASPAGVARLDVESDISQVVLASVMLVLGRPLYEDEFPAALPRVVSDVADVAQIRASSEFASGFVAFLQRALPLPDRRPYTSADDALIDLRDLASELGGLQQCRRALVDFIELMEPSGTQQPTADAEAETRPRPGPKPGSPTATPSRSEPAAVEPSPRVESSYDDVLADIASFGLYDSPELIEVEAVCEDDDWEEEEEEPGDEINLETLVEEPQYEPDAAPTPLAASRQDAAPGSDHGLEETAAPTQTPLATPLTTAAQSPISEEAETSSSVRSKRAKRTRSARSRKDKLRSAAVPTPLVTQKAEPVIAAPEAATVKPEPMRVEPEPVQPKVVEPEEKPRVEPIIAVKEHKDAPIAEPKHEHHAFTSESTDARKEDHKPEPPKAANDNWLVAPGRAAAFDPPVPEEP